MSPHDVFRFASSLHKGPWIFDPITLHNILHTLSESPIRLLIDVYAVTVVRPEDRGQGELKVPCISEGRDHVCQGEVKLFLAYGLVARPFNVTYSTSL